MDQIAKNDPNFQPGQPGADQWTELSPLQQTELLKKAQWNLDHPHENEKKLSQADFKFL